MNKNQMIDKIHYMVGRTGLRIKKHSPEIFVVAGIVGVVASAVMACKATTKINDILESSKEQIDSIHEKKDIGYIIQAQENDSIVKEEYTEDDSKKDLTIVYVQTAWKLTKLYGPSIILGGLSIASMVTSHKIMRNRYAALSAAYITVDKAFKDYRSRVIEKYGKDEDHVLRYNIKKETIQETSTDDKGKEVVTEKTVEVADPNIHSMYAKIFDETCPNWERDSERNLYFLRSVQNYMNDKLRVVGHVFLNEVYEQLGFPHTKAGAIVGWIYDPNNDRGGDGDNYIDFGLDSTSDQERTRAFVNGYEPSYYIDFNVDGIIYDLI